MNSELWNQLWEEINRRSLDELLFLRIQTELTKLLYDQPTVDLEQQLEAIEDQKLAVDADQLRSILDDLKEHSADYQELWETLADEASQMTLYYVIHYHCYGKHADLACAFSYTSGIMDYYFSPDLIHPSERGSVFVDCGSLDGLNSVEYALAFPDYGHIYAFEPMPVYAADIRQTVQELELRDVTVIEKAASAKSGSLSFDSNVKGSSKVTEIGALTVATCTIDEEIAEKISMLKMDIEGSEADALVGARRHIKEESPTLAICVYHKIGDFYKLFQLIRGWNPQYRYFIRHYSMNSLCETVLYCVHPDRLVSNRVADKRRSFVSEGAFEYKHLQESLKWLFTRIDTLEYELTSQKTCGISLERGYEELKEYNANIERGYEELKEYNANIERGYEELKAYNENSGLVISDLKEHVAALLEAKEYYLQQIDSLQQQLECRLENG